MNTPDPKPSTTLAAKTLPTLGSIIGSAVGAAIAAGFKFTDPVTVATIVTVVTEARGDQTEVALHHSGVPDDEVGRQHKDGWTWVLSALADVFTSRRPALSSDRESGAA